MAGRKRSGSVSAAAGARSASPAPAAKAPAAAAKTPAAAASPAAGAAAPADAHKPTHLVIPNKSGVPQLMIADLAGGAFASYTPSPQFLSGQGDANRKPRWLPAGWVTSWFLLTTLVVAWDAGYALYGSKLLAADPQHTWASRLWAPYVSTYTKVDMFYASDEAFAAAGLGVNAFGPAQSVLNVAEIVGNLLFLFLAVGMEAPSAAVVGIVTATATMMKTVLYWVVVAYYGWTRIVPSAAMASPDQVRDFFTLWFIPNGIWIVVPALVVLSLGKQLAHASAQLK